MSTETEVCWDVYKTILQSGFCQFCVVQDKALVEGVEVQLKVNLPELTEIPTLFDESL